MIVIKEKVSYTRRRRRRSKSGPVISYRIPVDKVDDVISGKIDPKTIKLPRSTDSKVITTYDAHLILDKMSELGYPYFYATWMSSPKDGKYYDNILVIDRETGEIIYNRPYMTRDKFMSYLSAFQRGHVIMMLQ